MVRSASSDPIAISDLVEMVTLPLDQVNWARLGHITVLVSTVIGVLSCRDEYHACNYEPDPQQMRRRHALRQEQPPAYLGPHNQ